MFSPQELEQLQVALLNISINMQIKCVHVGNHWAINQTILNSTDLCGFFFSESQKSSVRPKIELPMKNPIELFQHHNTNVRVMTIYYCQQNATTNREHVQTPAHSLIIQFKQQKKDPDGCLSFPVINILSRKDLTVSHADLPWGSHSVLALLNPLQPLGSSCYPPSGV